MKNLLFLAAWIVFLLPAAALADGICNRTFPVKEGRDTLQQIYCSNADITIKNSDITEFHINVHGIGRNPSATSDNVFAAMKSAGRDDIVNVFPQFVGADDEDGIAFVDEYGRCIDVDKDGKECGKDANGSRGGDLDPDDVLDLSKNHADYLHYNNTWNDGGLSSNRGGVPRRPFRISSFEVTNRMLQQAVDSYPNLERIVITGHSAGGQFAARYILSAVIPSGFPEDNVIFAPANPTSFSYVSGERPVQPLTYPITFAIPTRADCDGKNDPERFDEYNEYEVAVVDTDFDGKCDGCLSYPRSIPYDTLIRNLRERRMVHLVGLDDDSPTLKNIGQSCPSHLQGETRLDRFEAYFEHLKNEFGWGRRVSGKHDVIYMPGVGHSASDIYTSPCGQWFLFGVNADKCADRSAFSAGVDADTSQRTANGAGLMALAGNRSESGGGAAASSGASIDETLTLPVTAGPGVYSVTWAWRIGSPPLDASDEVIAEISVDGGGWTEVARLEDQVVSGSTWQYAGTTTTLKNSLQLRFVVNSDAAEEEVHVDAVRVERRQGL